MKTKVPVGKHTVRSLPIGLAIVLTMIAFHSSANHILPRFTNFSLHADTIQVQKQLSSKKYRIKLYPNANHQVLFFSASGKAGRIYQFYLFDLDGNLVKQVNIKNNQTTVLNKIDKGYYLFEVFSDDERIENGQVIVK